MPKMKMSLLPCKLREQMISHENLALAVCILVFAFITLFSIPQLANFENESNSKLNIFMDETIVHDTINENGGNVYYFPSNSGSHPYPYAASVVSCVCSCTILFILCCCFTSFLAGEFDTDINGPQSDVGINPDDDLNWSELQNVGN